jgi:hypothetical protein
MRFTAADHLHGCILLHPPLKESLRSDEAFYLATLNAPDAEAVKYSVRLETDNDPERLVCHFRECVRRMRMDAGLDEPAKTTAMSRLREARKRNDLGDEIERAIETPYPILLAEEIHAIANIAMRSDEEIVTHRVLWRLVDLCGRLAENTPDALGCSKEHRTGRGFYIAGGAA